ncbi:MAG: NUDIX hydrolase [Hyphomicrobiaceae bacterium]
MSIFARLFTTDHPVRQCAALPILTADDGSIRIGLITTRETGRWIIPKGWPKPGVPGHQSAAQEAIEEAGLEGAIATTPIATYNYRKRLHILASITCTVEVYPLHITKRRKSWPERAERQLQFLPPAAASKLVDDPGLARLLSNLPPLPASTP